MKNFKPKSKCSKIKRKNSKRSQSSKPETNVEPARETLESLLDRHGVRRWDYVLVGDGSGSNFNNACGWGCISIDRKTLKRECWSGGMSHGTVNIAEMMAYIQPLTGFASREAKRIAAGGEVRSLKVHIFTDSEYVQRMGKSGSVTPKANGAFWRIFDDFTRQGFRIHWHWIPRESVELNILADTISKAARILIKDNNIQQQVETVNGSVTRTVYDFNPST